MAGQNNVFHVEFGFNETELTSLLEAGLYKEAEKLVLQNAHTSYLDEGCYERTPLHIVLCGQDVNSEVGAVRNLYIGKCLVQHGASPNYRVPKTEFGYYLSPGETPLELLIHFYNSITSHDTCIQVLEEEDIYRPKHEKWDPRVSPVVGINQKSLTSLEDVKEDILTLVFIMLSHGGDCNVLNELRQTLLHRTAAYSSDSRMLECLCENGADLNAVDVHGNTALIYLCRYCQLMPYHMGEISECEYDENPLVWVKRTVENCCYGIKRTFIQTLLQYKDVQVDIKNKYGKTALFYCMERGDWQNALLLLQRGCSVVEQGQVSELEDFYKSTSPLFISMYSSRVIHYFYENYLCDRTGQGSNQIFSVPLVDPGYFSYKNITVELYGDMEENMKNINVFHIKQFGSKVLHLLFGHATCTLRQLCSRQIFQSWMRKYSQRVFSFADSDDSFSSLAQSQNSSPARNSNDQLQEQQHHLTHTATVSVPVKDDAVLLSGFQMYGSSNDATLSTIGVANDGRRNASENQQRCNDTPDRSRDGAASGGREDQETDNHDTEEDKLLQDEMSNAGVTTKDVEICNTRGIQMNDLRGRDSSLKNEYEKGSSPLSSMSDSAEDSSLNSSISKASSVNWPSRFSSLWKHLSQVTAAELDKELLSILHLPKDTLICFEIELLRLSLFLSRVTRYHRTCDWQRMEKMYGKGSAEPSDDSSITNDESDDEYW